MSNEHETFSEREGIVPRKDYRFDVDQVVLCSSFVNYIISQNPE